jgi:hypothetical protein
MFFAMGGMEISRSIIAALGFDRPVFPEISALLSAMVLITGYFLLKLKKRYQLLVEKSASIGRLLLSQTGMLVLLLLLAQALILFFPVDFILPLLKPIRDLFSAWQFQDIWKGITLGYAIISAPLLARYFARHLAGMRLDVAAILLLLPLLIALFIPLSGEIQSTLVPVTVDNIIYHNHLAQIILCVSMAVLLGCWIFSNPLSLALMDLVPSYLGAKLRRLRPVFANTPALFGFAIFYLWFAGMGYYFSSYIFVISATLTLLWVSISLLYSLTLRKR